MDSDTSIIRPQVKLGDISIRGQNMPPETLREIKKGLVTFHTLELMAVNIYKFQLTGKKSELNVQLIAAICNEMTHYQDFQIKLYEYGWKPSKLRGAYWVVGFFFGYVSRMFGTSAMLKTGIWVESKAIDHYDKLLNEINWDDDTRKIIEKNQADEHGHKERWKKMLNEMKTIEQ